MKNLIKKFRLAVGKWLMQELWDDHYHLEGEVDDLQTEAERLDVEVTDLETELNDLSEKVHDLRDEVDQTEIPDGDKIEADIDELSDRIEADIDELLDRIAALDRKVRDLA